jgi:hypothetical protein
MNPPVIFSCPVVHAPPPETRRDRDRRRNLAYAAIAIVAFLAGLLLGQLSAEDQHGSRIAWPPAGLLRSHAHPEANVVGSVA